MIETLRLKRNITIKCQNALNGVKAKMKKRHGVDEVVFVGMHIRRSDFEDYFQDEFDGKALDEDYFYRAMDAYR